MGAKATVVAVTTTPTVLNPVADSSYGTSSLVILPPAGSTVYVGGPAVATTNGLPVTGGQSLAVDVDNQETIYGVVASGTVNVNVLQTGI